MCSCDPSQSSKLARSHHGDACESCIACAVPVPHDLWFPAAGLQLSGSPGASLSCLTRGTPVLCWMAGGCLRLQLQARAQPASARLPRACSRARLASVIFADPASTWRCTYRSRFLRVRAGEGGQAQTLPADQYDADSFELGALREQAIAAGGPEGAAAAFSAAVSAGQADSSPPAAPDKWEQTLAVNHTLSSLYLRRVEVRQRHITVWLLQQHPWRSTSAGLPCRGSTRPATLGPIRVGHLGCTSAAAMVWRLQFLPNTPPLHTPPHPGAALQAAGP